VRQVGYLQRLYRDARSTSHKMNTTIPSEILVVNKHITGQPVCLKYGGSTFLEHARNNVHNVRNQVTNYS